MPGVLKNAIDWLSRPPSDIPEVFGDGGELRDEEIRDRLRSFMRGFAEFAGGLANSAGGESVG